MYTFINKYFSKSLYIAEKRFHRAISLSLSTPLSLSLLTPLSPSLCLCLPTPYFPLSPSLPLPLYILILTIGIMCIHYFISYDITKSSVITIKNLQ